MRCWHSRSRARSESRCRRPCFARPRGGFGVKSPEFRGEKRPRGNEDCAHPTAPTLRFLLLGPCVGAQLCAHLPPPPLPPLPHPSLFWGPAPIPARFQHSPSSSFQGPLPIFLHGHFRAVTPIPQHAALCAFLLLFLILWGGGVSSPHPRRALIAFLLFLHFGLRSLFLHQGCLRI